MVPPFTILSNSAITSSRSELQPAVLFEPFHTHCCNCQESRSRALRRRDARHRKAESGRSPDELNRVPMMVGRSQAPTYVDDVGQAEAAAQIQYNQVLIDAKPSVYIPI